MFSPALSLTITLALTLTHRRPFINPNDGFFEVLLDYAEELERERAATAAVTAAAAAATVEELAAERAESRETYHAYQLVAQLAFASVTLEEARVALKNVGGDLPLAASALLTERGI